MKNLILTFAILCALLTPAWGNDLSIVEVRGELIILEHNEGTKAYILSGREKIVLSNVHFTMSGCEDGIFELVEVEYPQTSYLLVRMNQCLDKGSEDWGSVQADKFDKSDTDQDILKKLKLGLHL